MARQKMGCNCMNIFEILAKRDIRPTDEFRRLVKLFNGEWDKGLYGKESLKDVVNGCLPLLPIRQSFLTVDEILTELNVSENTPYGVEWETLFKYCELLKNLINQAQIYIRKNENAPSIAQVIVDNIKVILEKTNHEWAQIKEGYIIVDKNPATTEAIECLEDNKADLALNMIEYNRVLLKGNLTRKREILVALADYTEPMNNDFKGTQYAALYSDSKFLVNAIDIRHNNSGKGDLPEKAKSWTSQEKEDWYDKTYQVLLTVILTRKHMDVSKEIQDLKPAKK